MEYSFDGKSYCVEECPPEYKFTDSLNKKCLKYARECPIAVSTDGKCIKEEECTGDNAIIDQTADHKVCRDKTHEGYSCPFESADGRRCVKSCSSIL